MARYLIERIFDEVSEAQLQAIPLRSKRLALERFPDITWEHTHMCSTPDGAVRSFCVYAASDKERLLEHADLLGSHRVVNVYEIVEDLDPQEITL